MKDLSALIAEIPEIETHFHEGFGLKTIHRDPAFNEWRAQVILLLKKQPKDDYTDSIISSLEIMNGHNDVAMFYDAVGKLKALAAIENEDKHSKLKQGSIVNTAFSTYTLVTSIGQGGNGIVWKAIDDSKKEVAIKFLERKDSKKIKRFKNEAFFCMRNTHKNIVTVSDFGVTETQISFYVMPLYATTLKQRIKEGLSGESAVSIFIGIVEGLQFAHQKGIVHRDIKPENILFQENSDEPVIADFGIAHFSEEELATVVDTQKGDRMANYRYAAPEQRNNNATVGPQADLYAAGLILNEMFTGEVPFAANYRKISDVAPDYKYLDYIVESLYLQEPEKRLYPEIKLLAELNVCAANHAKEVEKEKIQRAVVKANTPNKYSVAVKKVEFSNNRLFFELDNDLPNNWAQYLSGGYFIVASLAGYDHDRLLMIDSRNLVMSLYGGEDIKTIQSIAKHVKTWINGIGIAHSNVLAKEALLEQEKKEAERQAQLNQIDREIEINRALADL